MEYLDFELPLKDLKDQLEKCNMLGDESKVDVRDTSKKLKEKIEAKKRQVEHLKRIKKYKKRSKDLEI